MPQEGRSSSAGSSGGTRTERRVPPHCLRPSVSPAPIPEPESCNSQLLQYGGCRATTVLPARGTLWLAPAPFGDTFRGKIRRPDDESVPTPRIDPAESERGCASAGPATPLRRLWHLRRLERAVRRCDRTSRCGTRCREFVRPSVTGPCRTDSQPRWCLCQRSAG